MPPEALSWNDADDNNAYHEKLFVMDFDGTLSTELAIDQERKGVLPGDEDDGPAAMSNDGKTDAQPGRRRRRLHPEGREERRGGQGLHEVLHAAEGDEREPEGWPGPLGAADAGGREERPVLAGRPRIRIRKPYITRGCAGTDPCRLLWVQSRPGDRSPPSSSGGRPCADVIKNNMKPAGGGGQGVQARRGDLRQGHLLTQARRA